MNSYGNIRPYSWLIFIAWCVLLTFVIYGRSLSLPFFFDDFVHYPYVEAKNIAEIWLTTDQLAYYRPVNFTIWRITYVLMSGHNQALDHGINLLLHALNGVLVGWLAARLWGRGGNQFPVVTREDTKFDWWRAAISATLFLLFPFSYQAVPWVGSLSHIIVTTFILLALVTYVQMRRTRQRLWGMTSLILTALAPFAHENGVLIVPFIVFIELTTPQAPHRWWNAIKAGLIWFLPLLIYLPVWFSLPRLGSDRLFPNNLEGILQNLAYFLQGTFYPFTSFGGWLYLQKDFNDMLAVGLLGIVGFLTALFIQITQKATLRSLLPWLWIFLASLPSIIFLVFEYVINGPRLLMVASVGVAWLWADVFVLLGRVAGDADRGKFWRAAIVAILLSFLLVQNSLFLRERMDLHEELGDGFDQILTASENATEMGRELIVVNFPSWFAPKQSTFALGHEGVLFWPDYVPPGIFTAVHTGEFGDLSFVRADGIRPDLEDLYYGLTGPPPDWPQLSAVPSRVLVTEYNPEKLDLKLSGELDVHENDITEPTAVFQTITGDQPLTLLDAKAEIQGENFRVDLLWENKAAVENITVFVHLVDPQGQIVGQADGEPIGGSYPFELWAQGDRVWDTRWIKTAEPFPLTIRIGLYDRITGQRIEALKADGELWPDDAVPLEIVTPEP